ncbi:MAG: hypothetical protein IKP24_03830 [Alphaproteobacteria bacterium]|nr:hypothetical protein [Alphaproteobacteria bacterium]
MHKVAIFASFSGDGKIADYVLYYLKELKKVCDAIIFVADNPIFPAEVEKIKDLVIYASFKRHEEYDFGSYKRGYNYAKKAGILEETDELVLCNDSCFGPVYPFQEIFSKMDKNKDLDFWGLVYNTDVKLHLQSYFLAFKKNVIESNAIHDFLKRVQHEDDFWDVVYKYEFEFTDFLIKRGFKCAGFVPQEMPETQFALGRAGHNNPTVFPLTLIKKYNFPLIKVKCFTDGYTFALEEPIIKVLDFVKKQNPELYKNIISYLKHKDLYNSIYANNIDAMLDKADVVSFDVFDTLLIRPYIKPTDLFAHMEQIYDIPKFEQCRIQAESSARKIYAVKEDITYDDIYTQILPKYKSYKSKELLFEKQVLRIHPKNYLIYKKALKKHKKIIAVSDSYFPTKFIKDILQSNGITVDKVYVSGDYNKTKASGTLFEQVLKDFNIQPNQLLHIGDNEYSDVQIPQEKGIMAFHVKRYFDWFAQYGGNRKYVVFYNKKPCLERSVIVSQIARHQLTNSSSYWNDIGYCLAGPLAYGYTQKIMKETKRNNIDCLLFVARDGYILKNVYNMLEKQPIENHYIYAPRILNLKCFGDYSNNPEYHKKLIGLLTDVLSGAEVRFTPEQNIKIEKYYKENKDEYEKYLKTLNIKGHRIASVDMTTGAFSSEKFLIKFFKDRYAFGFFSATFVNDLYVKYISYMDKLIKPEKQESLMMLMELLITAPELPVVGIYANKPVYKKGDVYDIQRVEIVKQIEKGVNAFCQDYLDIFGFTKYLPVSMETNLDLLDAYCTNMSNIDTKYLKSVYHATDIGNEQYVSLYDEIVKQI